jgi:hypothetical protein
VARAVVDLKKQVLRGDRAVPAMLEIGRTEQRLSNCKPGGVGGFMSMTTVLVIVVLLVLLLGGGGYYWRR